jgi:Zn-dependent protease with chaperone function
MSASELCPQCKSSMVIAPGFRTWCSSCNWNAGIEEDSSSSGPLMRWYSNLGHRHGTMLLDRLCAGDPQKIHAEYGPRFVAAAIICLLVMGLSFVTGLLGMWLIWRFWPNFFAMIAGAGLIGLAWLQKPRVAHRPKDLLTRDQYPNLFKLIDDVAGAIGLQPIQSVRIDHEFNASMSEATWARIPVLTIGLPLWKILAPQARVALVAHELAHRANGDPARSSLLAAAIHALDQWINVLTQDANDQAVGLSAVFANAAMWLVLQLILAVRYSIMLLLYLDSQRAEYFADFLAARVAGSEAMKSTLASLAFHKHLEPYLLRNFAAVDASGTSVLESFRKFVGSMPAHEIERLWRCQLAEHAQIDTSHPPTAYRVRFLEAHPVELGLVLPSDLVWQKIDAELKPLEVQMSERLISATVGDR